MSAGGFHSAEDRKRHLEITRPYCLPPDPVHGKPTPVSTILRRNSYGIYLLAALVMTAAYGVLELFGLVP